MVSISEEFKIRIKDDVMVFGLKKIKKLMLSLR